MPSASRPSAGTGAPTGTPTGTPGFQAEKDLVRAYYRELDAASGHAVPDVLARYTSPHWSWRGYHPFHEMRGAQKVAETFWQPLRQSLRRMQRRMDIFMAGANVIGSKQIKTGAAPSPSTWVVSMGHLMGLFDAPWLGIAPTGKMAMLRYCEFNRVESGKITETAMYFDLPHLMMQAGLQPFPPQTGAHMVQPGPATHDGLMFAAQNPAQGKRTLAAIDHMINALGNWDNRLSLEEELALSWHDDMIWWGPAGIGSAYTIERYAKQHAGPFRQGFKDRVFNGHVCKIAEGSYGGFFGWPNLRLKPAGGFMGMPGSEKESEMRVIDIYRRDGDRLAENWVFIDLLHFWNQQGVDILGRMATVPRT